MSLKDLTMRKTKYIDTKVEAIKFNKGLPEEYTKTYRQRRFSLIAQSIKTVKKGYNFEAPMDGINLLDKKVLRSMSTRICALIRQNRPKGATITCRIQYDKSGKVKGFRIYRIK